MQDRPLGNIQEKDQDKPRDNIQEKSPEIITGKVQLDN